jgi:hypothetical protein
MHTYVNVCTCLLFVCPTLCFSSIQDASFEQQPAEVCADQCQVCSAAGFWSIPRPRHVHVHTVDSGLWRLHLQRRLRRCAARAHRLLPHARWFAGSPGKVYNVGATRRFPRHDTDDVSTLMCACVGVPFCCPLPYKCRIFHQSLTCIWMCLSCCLCEITRTPLSGITCTPLIIT